MLIAHYKTKKELKAAVGMRLSYSETSIFGAEYKENGWFCVTNQAHTWFAEVTMAEGIIDKVK